ncbi:hypothetical protein [Ruminococcus sp.]|uniref:hypothetical protein n=1 Tax=Ruminococcus sp. TaxID=41978 RepID=UPI0025F1C464|nr:hypothetical protein [Ruminococcus sp.]MBQ8965009.1 hypothetical protein [Ruminococcus sp.]
MKDNKEYKKHMSNSAAWLGCAVVFGVVMESMLPIALLFASLSVDEYSKARKLKKAIGN